MELTPRLFPLVVALVLVFASPYVVGAQTPSQPSPARGGLRGQAPAKPPAPGAAAPSTPPSPAATAPKPPTPAPQSPGPAPQASQPSRPPTPAASAGQAAPKAAVPAPAPAASAAQAPAPKGAAPAPQPAGPQLEPQGYTYDPAGRRDPFVSLVQRGSDTTQRSTLGARGAGLAGLETGEVTLKGTIATQGGFVAIVMGSDNKTYIVRPGEKLADGTIRTITQDSMVITQLVTDPLSLEKTREVRKVLRQTEEAK